MIGDWGVRNTYVSRIFEIIGTRYYRSPEMVTGEGVTFTSDWWAFGILIFELLAG